MSSVYPSGAALATRAPPAMPAAAPTFSITIDCPSSSPMRCERADIDAAPGGEGNDERDRPRGPILRGGVTAERDHGCRGGDHPAHARLLLAPDLRARRRRDQGRRCRGGIIVAALPSSHLGQFWGRCG